jgi:hypothetical protein
LIYTGELAKEELDVEEKRKARHKKEGGQRRITNYGVILGRDARLKIAGRQQYLDQKKEERRDQLLAIYNAKVSNRWGITARSAVRWSKK